MVDEEEVMFSKFVMWLVCIDIVGFWIVCYYNKVFEIEINVINKIMYFLMSES